MENYVVSVNGYHATGVEWNYDKTVSGQLVEYSTNKDFKNAHREDCYVAPGIQQAGTSYELKKSKLYYFRVKNYNILSDGTKIYSAWSKVKSSYGTY